MPMPDDRGAAAYPVTYQRETSPTWLHHAAVLGGAAARDPARPFRYLELGCGRGYSALIHAASHPNGEFHACDRDATVIDEARGWARALELKNIEFHAASFEEIAARETPPFDYIAAHGVYSWVREAARATIRGLLRERLAPGGLAYVSYNCLPGWAGELPLRRFLAELSGGGVEAGARELDRLRAAGLAYFAAHPAADRAVASWAGQPVGYLAHEYLAEAWEPMWSVDMIDAMAAEGLYFAGSATLRDAHEALLVDAAAARAIAQLATPRLRMLAMDFAVNRGFRRDVFAKGAPVADANRTALRDLLIGGAGDIAESIVVPRGRISFNAEFIAALRALMVKGPVRLGDAVRALGDTEEAARNLLWLTAAGSLAPVAPDQAAGERARADLKRLGVVPLA